MVFSYKSLQANISWSFTLKILIHNFCNHYETMEVKHLGHKGQVHLLQTQKTQISENTIYYTKNVTKKRQIIGRPSTIPTTG